jgi:Chemotaxis response regulator containing a CheY-like receiver domain and a methylesterase domain
MDESTSVSPHGSPPPTSAEEVRLQPAPDHAEEDLADVSDDAIPTRSFAMLPMVGLGGSAGSIAALQGFFAATPSDSGMAFVVVMHLSAEHESALAQILQRSTTMPVQQVQGQARVEANHVYVIPPGKTLSTIDGHLVCADLTPYQGRRVAVDLFFAPSPTATARTRRRSSSRAPTATARSASSGSRSAAD